MKKKLGHRENRERLIYIVALVAVLSLFVPFKFGLTQLYYHEGLKEAMRDKSTAEELVHRPRGKIVDRDGLELAVSIPTRSLFVDGKDMIRDGIYIEEYEPAEKVKFTEQPVRWLLIKLKLEAAPKAKLKRQEDKRKLAARLLSPVLKMDEAQLFKLFSDGESRFKWVKRMLNNEETKAVRKIIRDNELPGFGFKIESKRYYTKGMAAAQVIGFVGAEDTGRSGLEYYLNDELQLSEETIEYFKDRYGKRLFDESSMDSVEIKVPTAYLTIDSHMQYVLEQAIDDAVKAHEAKGAIAIIMDPYTGEILSMVSRPTFDPNHYGDYPKENWTNKAVTYAYEPGSIFKPIVGCIGMSKGVVNPNTPFYDSGHINVADRVFRNWDGEGMGDITFTDVIKFSNNVGMIKLGQRIGKESMVAGAKNFGFGVATDVDLPGEADGLLFKKEMYDPELATFSIGQGISVTPLQELRAVCAIANGGELVKPYIIKKLVDAKGKVLREGHKEVVRNVITEQVARDMRMMMEKVVSEGGGKKAAIKGYRIAGKTGTAEKASNGHYAAGEYIASFVGFVPADKPKYAMLVMIDTPKGGRIYGSQVSAPIFKNVLQQILVLKGVQPSSQEGLPSLEALKITKSNALKPLPKLEILASGKMRMPNLQGLTISQATELLTSKGLRVRPHGAGKIARHSPAAGSEISPNSIVELWLE